MQNYDKLKNLISMMKSRIFSNYRYIYPLLYNRKQDFTDFINQNYKKYQDYCIRADGVQYYDEAL